MSSETGRPPIFVHLLPAWIPPGALRGGVAVVVDVLRATTVMVQALAAGCRAVVPCAEIEEARALRDGLPSGTGLLAGERRGLPIPGFDLGNSPGAFTPEICREKTLVMTTTNGTRAILASLDARRVCVAAFSNLMATVAHLRDEKAPLHIVCSGTDGQVSFEDAVLAGALACDLQHSRRLGEAPRLLGNDEAELVTRLWGTVPLGGEHEHDPEELAGVLSRGRGGHRVREIGLEEDIREAARMDRFPIVAEVARDPLRVVRL